jgi:hypothetical protein
VIIIRFKGLSRYSHERLRKRRKDVRKAGNLLGESKQALPEYNSFLLGSKR